MANNHTLRVLTEPTYDRQHGESVQAWLAFTAYRDLEHRTLLDAYHRATPSSHASQISGQWRHWASVWQWSTRTEAWDSHLDEIGRATQEQAARNAAVTLADARRNQRNKELEIGDKLLQRAAEMLALPVIEVTTERQGEGDNARVIQTIKPAKWRMADAAAIARMGVELKRLSLDMDTSRTSIRVDIEDEVRRLARDNGWDEDATVLMAAKFAEESGT